MEYARNALRMSALMGQRVLYVFTHDSIGLGEDGPTHQPVEQLTACAPRRTCIPGGPAMQWRSAIAWKQAVKRDSGPTALVFSRQTLPSQVANAEHVAGAHRGGYVLVSEQGSLDAILIATGSEVSLAVEAAARLSGSRGIQWSRCPVPRCLMRRKQAIARRCYPVRFWRA